MTRDHARRLERQLRQRYPEGDVDVTRVFGGVEVEAGTACDRVFLRTTDDSPLLVLLGVDPETRLSVHRDAGDTRAADPGVLRPERRRDGVRGLPQLLEVLPHSGLGR